MSKFRYDDATMGFSVQGTSGREIFHITFNAGKGPFYSRNGNPLEDVVYCTISRSKGISVEEPLVSGWTARSREDEFVAERSFAQAFEEALKGNHWLLGKEEKAHIRKTYRAWLKGLNLNG